MGNQSNNSDFHIEDKHSRGFRLNVDFERSHLTGHLCFKNGGGEKLLGKVFEVDLYTEDETAVYDDGSSPYEGGVAYISYLRLDEASEELERYLCGEKGIDRDDVPSLFHAGLARELLEILEGCAKDAGMGISNVIGEISSVFIYSASEDRMGNRIFFEQGDYDVDMDGYVHKILEWRENGEEDVLK